MKTTLLLLITLFSSTIVFSQYEIGLGLGSAIMVKKPGDVDVQSAFNASLYIHREFRLAHKIIFEPTLSLISGRYFIDGNFKKDAVGQTTFGITPSNYKQNRLEITGIRVPLLLKYELFSNSSGEGIAIGAGPYLEYVVSMRQVYKTTNNYSEEAPINNRFQAGLALDFGTSGRIIKDNRFGFGAGLQYQLTDYLKNNNPSFKPMVVYLRAGFRF
jgi:hypothetical protein